MKRKKSQAFTESSFMPVLWLSFILFSCFALSGSGQKVSVRTWFDRDSILIGDQIHYNIELFQPRGLTVQMPEFSDTLNNSHIEILEKSPRDTIQTGEEVLRISQHYLITCFDSGLYTIPAQRFSYTTPQKQAELLSQPAFLQVLTMPLDTAQAIFDIKGPYRAPITFTEILPYLLGLIILVALVWLILRYIKKRNMKKSGYIPTRPPEPPHIIAIRSLDQLKERKLWQNNRVKLYYSRITDILRIYLEGRYGISAMESTSNEILNDLKATGFNDNRLYTKLQDMLQLADLVKFAKVHPAPGENETCMLDAYIFINETKQVEKPVPEEQENQAEGEPVKQKINTGFPEHSSETDDIKKEKE